MLRSSVMAIFAATRSGGPPFCFERERERRRCILHVVFVRVRVAFPSFICTECLSTLIYMCIQHVVGDSDTRILQR